MKDSAATEIHEASIALLENPGIKLDLDCLGERLLRAGAAEGHGAEVVRIPPKMVREAMDCCPKTLVLTDRRGVETRLSARSEPVFWSCPGMFLYRGGAHRPFTSRDMADMARLLGRLENMQAIFGMDQVKELDAIAERFIGKVTGGTP